MFRCCFRRKKPSWYFLINYNSSSITKKQISPSPSSFIIPFFSPFSISSSSNYQEPSSFTTVNYLINSCGLTPQEALSASTKINLKNPENPNSVLSLLRNHGFTNANIKQLISKCPMVLTSKSEKVLKPKLQCFLDLGLPVSDLPKLVFPDPSFLYTHSLSMTIRSIDVLKGLLHTNENIVKAIKRSKWLLKNNLEKSLLPNVAILQSHGIPNSDISKMIMRNPRMVMLKRDKFHEIVVRVKELGFHSGSPSMFVEAVWVIASLSKSTWEAKIEIFKSMGWSQTEIITAFKNRPACMRCSEEKLRKSMDFFMNKLNWKPSRISSYPSVLVYNFENRIIPRCRVLKILTSKNLIKKKFELTTMITISEKKFLQKYVTMYQKEAPDVLKAYRSAMGSRKGSSVKV